MPADPIRADPPPASSFAGDVCAGAALGAFLGLVMGLTTSPVASIVVAALVALLAALFGLSDKGGAGFSGSAARRLAAFGLAAVVMTPASIWVRVHEVLGVSVAQQRQILKDIGIVDANEQKAMLRVLRFGGAPASAAAGAKPVAAAAAGAPILYSVPTSLCHELTRLRIIGASVDDFDKLFAASGDKLARLGAAVAPLPVAQRKVAYEAATASLCSP